jgi:hypothetical protein
MYIDKLDIDHVAATDSDPGFPYPFDVNVPVDQNVKVGVSVLLKFQDTNVLRGGTVMTLQVNAQLRKYSI